MDRYFDSQPTRISGVVMDAISGKPVPGADVPFKEMNGWRPATQADWRGRFTAVTEQGEMNPYYLYASGPSVGKLLGTTFYTPVLARRHGERHYGIVLPTVPATEISGHVYDTGGKPLSGCDVTVFTEDPERWAVDFVTTDNTGAFSFMRLGANRFLIAAECRNYLPGERWRSPYPPIGIPWPVRDSWLTAMLPERIVVLPGEKRRGLALHMVSVPHYSIHGKVVFSGGEKPTPGRLYLHEVSIVPLPPLLALEENPIQSSNCNWDTARGEFQCDFLPAGRYHLRFGLDWSEAATGPQQADVVVEVKDQRAPQPELTVQLKKWEPKPFRHAQPPAHETGHLHLRFACPDQLKAGWLRIWTQGSGDFTTISTPITHKCSEDATWPAETGQYVMTAYQSGWFGRRGNTLESFFRRRGSSFTITKDRTTDVTLRPVSTGEVIQTALAALRNER